MPCPNARERSAAERLGPSQDVQRGRLWSWKHVSASTIGSLKVHQNWFMLGAYQRRPRLAQTLFWSLQSLKEWQAAVQRYLLFIYSSSTDTFNVYLENCGLTLSFLPIYTTAPLRNAYPNAWQPSLRMLCWLLLVPWKTSKVTKPGKTTT